VDDFLVCGTERFHQSVLQKICTKFLVGSRQEGNFKYVGLNITKLPNAITIKQDQHVDEIDEFNIDQGERSNNDNLHGNEIRMLRSIVGQIQWVSTQTRPDASYDALYLSVERNKATVATMKRARKVVKKLKSCSSSVTIKAVGSDMKLKVFLDA